MRRLWCVVAVGLALAACGSDTTASSTASASGSSASSSSPSASSSSSGAGGTTTTVKVYFLRDEKVGPAGRSVPQTQTPARTAMEELLKGPTGKDTSAGLSTTIPSGTTLNRVSIDQGIATVDLSSEFGAGGGSTSMQGRVAQVVYTLTQFPTVTAVSFELDGKPATTLGGEGVVLDHPQARGDWEAFTPAILVETPLPQATVTSPAHVVGTANTFEATFQIRLTDASGKKLYEHFATATSGTGTRGTFDEAITFDPVDHGSATLTVYELSAKDGSEINVVSIPVSI